MKDRRRVLALALCLCMALVFAVSSLFIIREADHACSGEGCEICACITAVSGLMRSLALPGMVLSALPAAPPAVRKTSASFRCFAFPAPTPVGWKIRLNN